MNILAIDIGGTKFSLVLFDDEAISARVTRATDRAGGPEWMVGQILEVARDWQFDRCGIGFGGPVDFARQQVLLSTHVGGWDNFPLVERLRDLWHVPVAIDRDTNAGALGESRYGAGRGALPLLYVTLSTGIGGGIVLADGKIYRGADSWAGEIGHIALHAQILHAEGPECLCGARGCFERICSGLWLERDHGKPARELLTDPSFVARYVIDIAQGLKTAIMLLNPARILIGGGIAQAGDRLFTPLRAELRRQMTAWSQARIDVMPADLGNDSVLWGAMALAREI